MPKRKFPFDAKTLRFVLLDMYVRGSDKSHEGFEFLRVYPVSGTALLPDKRAVLFTGYKNEQLAKILENEGMSPISSRRPWVYIPETKGEKPVVLNNSTKSEIYLAPLGLIVQLMEPGDESGVVPVNKRMLVEDLGAHFYPENIESLVSSANCAAYRPILPEYRKNGAAHMAVRGLMREHRIIR